MKAHVRRTADERKCGMNKSKFGRTGFVSRTKRDRWRTPCSHFKSTSASRVLGRFCVAAFKELVDSRLNLAFALENGVCVLERHVELASASRSFRTEGQKLSDEGRDFLDWFESGAGLSQRQLQTALREISNARFPDKFVRRTKGNVKVARKHLRVGRPRIKG